MNTPKSETNGCERLNFEQLCTVPVGGTALESVAPIG